MNNKKTFQFLIVLNTLLSLLAGCNPAHPSSATITTVAATATISPTPAPTFVPSATPSPVPSRTPEPAIGLSFSSRNWEGTVLAAAYRASITIWGNLYVAGNGHIMVEVTMRVKNLNPATNPSTLLANDVIIDEQGNTWQASLWGDLPAAKAQGKDPFEISFTGGGMESGKLSDGGLRDESVKIENESILRFHYNLKSTLFGKTVSFKFEDLPAVSFVISKP